MDILQVNALCRHGDSDPQSSISCLLDLPHKDLSDRWQWAYWYPVIWRTWHRSRKSLPIWVTSNITLSLYIQKNRCATASLPGPPLFGQPRILVARNQILNVQIYSYSSLNEGFLTGDQKRVSKQIFDPKPWEKVNDGQTSFEKPKQCFVFS